VLRREDNSFCKKIGVIRKVHCTTSLTTSNDSTTNLTEWETLVPKRETRPERVKTLLRVGNFTGVMQRPF